MAILKSIQKRYGEDKINKILNENNFANEDCIVILRIFLSKLKRLLKIHERVKNENFNNFGNFEKVNR